MQRRRDLRGNMGQEATDNYPFSLFGLQTVLNVTTHSVCVRAHFSFTVDNTDYIDNNSVNNMRCVTEGTGVEDQTEPFDNEY